MKYGLLFTGVGCMILFVLLRMSHLKQQVLEEENASLSREKAQLKSIVVSNKIALEALLFRQKKIDVILVDFEKNKMELRAKSLETKTALDNLSKNHAIKEWSNVKIPMDIAKLLR